MTHEYVTQHPFGPYERTGCIHCGAPYKAPWTCPGAVMIGPLNEWVDDFYSIEPEGYGDTTDPVAAAVESGSEL